MKIKIKPKYIKKCKGLLSIFLCLIISPLLTLTGALIEYSRLQNSVETTKEIMDVSTSSTLSNYDEYLNERFGLLALSQDTNANSLYSEYYRSGYCFSEKGNIADFYHTTLENGTSFGGRCLF